MIDDKTINLIYGTMDLDRNTNTWSINTNECCNVGYRRRI